MLTKRTSNTRCVLVKGGAAPHAPLQSGVLPPFRTQRRGTRRRGQVQPVGVEVVKCADCPRTFERPIVPKGRPRLYCTKSCANYASRRRVKGTTLTPVKVAMHNWQAQHRAAPPPASFSQALQALRGLPDLHAILSGENPDAVQSAHGHEALRRSPAEATSAPAHPAETQQKPTNLRTRPTKGDERKRK